MTGEEIFIPDDRVDTKVLLIQYLTKAVIAIKIISRRKVGEE
jgi:hypothetical protein